MRTPGRQLLHTVFALALPLCCSVAMAAEAPQQAQSATVAAAPPPAQTRSVTIAERSVEVPVEAADNPLVLLQTSLGDLVIELFPQEAPQTVANFLGLATGTKAFTDPETGGEAQRPFYDGLSFHRVIDGFMIQTGSPTGLGDGNPGYRFEDEIGATSLGLDKMLVLDGNGVPNPVLGVRSQRDFQQRVLAPLYKSMGISNQQQLDVRLAEVDQSLRTSTVKGLYEQLGYHYRSDLQSRAPVRGIVAMANSGPDHNGSQFFINLVDTPWLTGKHTVFGKVRLGMEIADMIGKVPVDADSRPLQPVTVLGIRPL
ncbi:MAG TPA: peptidylprolyl isomerase [Candidatus Acidoferrum sp.]|nr:peptidylprolyl isomerase [Candidatus Acidoferrum sp.]